MTNNNSNSNNNTSSEDKSLKLKEKVVTTTTTTETEQKEKQEQTTTKEDIENAFFDVFGTQIPEFTNEDSKNKKKKNKKEKENKEEDDEGEPVKELLFEFAETYIKLLFKDQFGKLFAYAKIRDEHYEIMSLSSHKFERYLFKIFYDSELRLVLSKESRSEIIDYLQSKTEFSGVIKRLELRVAKTDDNNDTFYYDLTNSEGSVIKITPEGWTVEKTPPILFRRYSGQLPQVTPSL